MHAYRVQINKNVCQLQLIRNCCHEVSTLKNLEKDLYDIEQFVKDNYENFYNSVIVKYKAAEKVAQWLTMYSFETKEFDC